ncbi:hypothetical protein [Aminicella lysinilytica]|uniref:Uncharacterized protein n=1 Tax=Aminicella lysinilytica TaxID=433323 RepID=A0A4R6PY61_9FIRM|nr:hypothetical protein [Aminicella lysinilytica]TDP51840.1 hypothetical protein EV211_12917 [Aminicella lysinilytica]
MSNKANKTPLWEVVLDMVLIFVSGLGALAMMIFILNGTLTNKFWVMFVILVFLCLSGVWDLSTSEDRYKKKDAPAKKAPVAPTHQPAKKKKKKNAGGYKVQKKHK